MVRGVILQADWVAAELAAAVGEAALVAVRQDLLRVRRRYLQAETSPSTAWRTCSRYPVAVPDRLPDRAGAAW